MIPARVVAALCLGTTLCAAQAISISGIVTDTAGAGIDGATVRLEQAGISTSTGADGSFTLTGDPTAMQPDLRKRTTGSGAVRIQNGRITISVSENVPVAVSIHDVGGRQVYSNRSTYGSGTHVLHAPLLSGEMYLYRVTIDKETFLSAWLPFGTFSAEPAAVSGGAAVLGKQAILAGVISDVISVVKEGQLDYRDSIRTSDTSGIIVMMLPNAGNVTDTNGNVYQSVRIGEQVWTVQNLKVTKYRDGTDIPHVSDETQWSDLTIGAFCHYENNAANGAKYGALYNWYAVNSGRLTPKGWHVPTDAEWETLKTYLTENGYNWDGSTTANRTAKSLSARTDWKSEATVGTPGNDPASNNSTGFSALPGGYRTDHGAFNMQSCDGFWWSATEFVEPSRAYCQYLYYGSESLSRFYKSKPHGFSVRLVRD